LTGQNTEMSRKFWHFVGCVCVDSCFTLVPVLFLSVYCWPGLRSYGLLCCTFVSGVKSDCQRN
jgi:hypothetical protein